MLVESSVELDHIFDDPIGQIDEVVSHGEDLAARVRLLGDLILHTLLVGVLLVGFRLLQVLLRREERLRLDRLHGKLHRF